MLPSHPAILPYSFGEINHGLFCILLRTISNIVQTVAITHQEATPTQTLFDANPIVVAKESDQRKEV